jgi:hypothetical protein
MNQWLDFVAPLGSTHDLTPDMQRFLKRSGGKDKGLVFAAWIGALQGRSWSLEHAAPSAPTHYGS